MNQFYELVCVILLSCESSSHESFAFQRTGEMTRTNVVSLTFCESRLPAEEKMRKKTLEEVHTYAELKNDPRALLPQSFFTIMISGCQSSGWPKFFNILDDNKEQLMVPFIIHGVIESRLQIVFDQSDTQQLIGKVPPLFPNQWTTGCLAVNTTSGHIHWVVEGSLVLADKFEEVANLKDLSGKLVLGANSFGGL